MRACQNSTCSAEDLIVHKCFADRERDWADVEGVLARRKKELDMELILTKLAPLVTLKNAPEILSKLEKKITDLP